MSKVSVIVSGNIQNQQKVDQYKNIAGSVMKKYQATLPPKSYQVGEVFAGSASPSFMLEIEFPNSEKAAAAFNDPDYISAINNRDEGFGDLSIFMVS